METAIETAIKALAEKSKEAQAHEAMHLSQAALNLAHTLQVLKQVKQ
jgi:hypothetical protein